MSTREMSDGEEGEEEERKTAGKIWGGEEEGGGGLGLKSKSISKGGFPCFWKSPYYLLPSLVKARQFLILKISEIIQFAFVARYATIIGGGGSICWLS